MIYPHRVVAKGILSAVSAKRSTGNRTVHGLILMHRRALLTPTGGWVAERYEIGYIDTQINDNAESVTQFP